MCISRNCLELHYCDSQNISQNKLSVGHRSGSLYLETFQQYSDWYLWIKYMCSSPSWCEACMILDSWDCRFEPGSRHGYTIPAFSVLWCSVYVESLRVVNLSSKEFYLMSGEFIVSELILYRNRPEEFVCKLWIIIEVYNNKVLVTANKDVISN
jgi:hypothetical protein